MSNCNVCDRKNKDDKQVCCQPPNCRYIPHGVEYMIDKFEGGEKTIEGRCLKIRPRDLSIATIKRARSYNKLRERRRKERTEPGHKKEEKKAKERAEKIAREKEALSQQYSITPGKFDYLSDFVLQLSPKEKKRMEKLFLEPELEKRLHERVKISRPKSVPAISELSSEKVEVPVIPIHVPPGASGALDNWMNRPITWARQGRNKKTKTQRKHKIKRKSKRNKINRLSKRKIKRLSKRKIKRKSKRKTR